MIDKKIEPPKQNRFLLLINMLVYQLNYLKNDPRYVKNDSWAKLPGAFRGQEGPGQFCPEIIFDVTGVIFEII